jgi:pyruvate/2-oxoglutarate/acetoin dehydrogenase E1 component
MRVVSIFPRWNFLLCATNQLVSHVDKYPTITSGIVKPGLIIRTGVGSVRPLFPGHQHVGNMSEAFRLMLTNVDIIELHEPNEIYPAYQHAYNRTDCKSTLLVEFGDYYSEK